MPTQLFSNSSEPKSIPVVPNESGTGVVFTHAIEPELAGASIPRVARLTKTNIVTRRVLWNLFAVLIGLIGFFWRRDYDTWNALITRGITTNATVYGVNMRTGKSTSYYLDYRFSYKTSGGYGTIEGTQEIDRDTYEQTHEGDKLPVTYLPDNPVDKWQVYGATPERRDAQSLHWLTWGITTAVFCGTGMALFIFNAKRQLRFLQEGVAVMGYITTGEVIRGKTNIYRLHYAYDTQSATRKGSADVGVERYNAMTQGNPYFTVLYDATHPAKSIAYFQVTQAYLVAAASN